MGRVRERFPKDEDFLRAMAAALNWSINGEWDRTETECQHVEAARAQLKILEDYARTRPDAEELLARLPQIEAVAEAARHQVITRTGIPASAPPETWHLYVPAGESRTAPGFGFSTEPVWDEDDVAEYCLLKEAEESHRRVFLRWLAHRWCAHEVPEARAALVKTFQPLVRSLVAAYRRRGQKEQGDEYEVRAGEYLQATLGKAIDDFDFFHKRYDPVLKIKFNDEINAYRRAGNVTSECELPIANYLVGNLTAAIREFLGIEWRNPNRVPGPFRVQGCEGKMLLLIEDATELLGVRESQVRRRIAKNQLRAWRPKELKRHLGLPDDHALVLVSAAGEVNTAGHKYWIIDVESVMELRARKGSDGMYGFGRRGRPRKRSRQAEVPPIAPGSPAVPPNAEPQARLVREEEPENWPVLQVRVVAEEDEEEPEK